MQRGDFADGFELNDVNGLIEAIEEQMKGGTFRRRSSGRAVNPAKAEQITAAWDNAKRACRDCDVLLVIGTSAVVYPAAGLIGVAKAGGARIIVVNTQASDAGPLADIQLLGPAGEIVPQLLARD